MESLTNILLGAASAIVMALHLMCVNIAAVGPLACIGLWWRSRRTQDADTADIGRWLALFCNKSLAAGIVLGFAQVLLLHLKGDSGFFRALAQVPAGRLYWGAAELLFYFLCMLPYALAWQRLGKGRIVHPLLAVLAATNLIYHFPPLFTILAQLANGDHGREALDPAAFRGMLVDGQVVARVLHHLLAAVAVVGVVLAERATHTEDATMKPSPVRLVRRAACWALGASLLQIPSGVWLLLKVTAPQRGMLMGGDWLASGLFVGSLVGALVLMHKLAAIAMGETDRRSVVLAARLLLGVILMMSGVLVRLGG